MGKGCTEHLLSKVDPERFDGVEIIATLVVSLPGKSFGVPSVQITSNDVPYGRGNDVLRGNHPPSVSVKFAA